MLRTVDKFFAAFDKWYAENRQSERNFPKCYFCGGRKFATGPQTYSPSRVMSSRVRAIAVCKGCGMRYQASRYPDSKRWSFETST